MVDQGMSDMQRLENIVIAGQKGDTTYSIELTPNSPPHITPHSPSTKSEPDPAKESTPPTLAIPTLCHPHVHLDKAYLLTSNQQYNIHAGDSTEADELPDYSDLALQDGTFQEALSFTSKAKARYTKPDLLLRGSQLIAESVTYGVTSMRAFVEIDHVTQFKCLECAIRLKKDFANYCHIQIVAFAQDPVFSGEHGDENRKLMEEAIKKHRDDIDVLGTTPYVEDSFDTGLRNVGWAIKTALTHGLHLDFHLDYNVDAQQKPMVFDVVEMLAESQWSKASTSESRTIVLGHCTRMTLCADDELRRLREMVGNLPISFVGLPTSDLFMMGRPDEKDQNSSDRTRGTLQILDLIRKYKFDACIGINNVGNAFTPWGSPDPLTLASLGVGIYQAGTADDAELLFQCVSDRARRAIGLGTSRSLIGLPAEQQQSAEQHLRGLFEEDVLLVRNERDVVSTQFRLPIPARQRRSIRDVVWDPPERMLRQIVYARTK